MYDIFHRRQVMTHIALMCQLQIKENYVKMSNKGKLGSYKGFECVINSKNIGSRGLPIDLTIIRGTGL